jgi:hypothetical protein
MPNHVTTVCTVTGSPSDVARFVATHITPWKRRTDTVDQFDFDTIIPMPQSVKDTIRPMFDEATPEGVPLGQVGDGQIELYAEALIRNPRTFVVYRPGWLPEDVRRWGELRAWLDDKHPAAAFWARRALIAAAETGSPGWYEWSCAHWQTKWGSYDFKRRDESPGSFVFEFQTAWAFPEPIFAKLAAMYPECIFSVVTIDEGGPEYEGRYAGTSRVFERVPKSVERYRLVYGREPYSDDDDEAETATN